MKNTETVKIINPLQASKYMKHGVNPVSFYYDEKTEKLVFEFLKADTKELYKKWLERNL